jgi:hypothetical protein
MLLQGCLGFIQESVVLFQKARVEFESVHAEGGGQLDPFEKRHRAIDAKLVHEAFREGG